MDFSKILSISGKPGLFKVVSQLKNAVLVESLLDKKKFPAFAHEKISSLQEISIFTTGEDKPLKDILKTMFEKLEGKPAPDGKSDNKALTVFFHEMIPDYDTDRVYVSDIRKVVNWYNLLLENNLLDFSNEEEKEEKSGDETVAHAEEVKETAAKKKKAPGAKPDKQGKQVKPSAAKVAKKSDHRSIKSN